MPADAMQVIGEDAVETLAFPWGTIRMLATVAGNRAGGCSFGIVASRPGGAHELHHHPGEGELIYILAGAAELHGEGTPRRLRPGDLIVVPAGCQHAVLNVGSDVLRVLIVYTPAGPERELRRLPDCQILPATAVPTSRSQHHV